MSFSEQLEQVAAIAASNAADVDRGAFPTKNLDALRGAGLLGLVSAADQDPAIKRRMRRFIAELRERMTPVFAAGGLRADPESIAFFHSVIVGCAVLQLARDNSQARAEAKAVLRMAASFLQK